MTLKELLDSLSFDEIAPYLIIRHYTRDYASGDLVPYKHSISIIFAVLLQPTGSL